MDIGHFKLISEIKEITVISVMAMGLNYPKR
jgi:hypothetical protein